MYKPFNFHKGSVSKTRKGRKAFITHKGSKVYNRKGHYVKKNPLPFMMGGWGGLIHGKLEDSITIEGIVLNR